MSNLMGWLQSNRDWVSLALILLAFIVGMVVALYTYRVIHRRRGKRNRKRGRTAEKRAQKMLKSEGYRILDIEPVYHSELLVNGELECFDVTPDLLVEKDGQRYVVEIKRYRDRGWISNATVRRQILEYLHASGLACLLVRMPDGHIDHIDLEEAE